jgi:putative transposase
LLSTCSQSDRTFFVTSVTDGRRAILQSECMARLLLDVLYSYRSQGRFLLHEFVIMPDHFYLLITPAVNVSLEKALQFVKGGFSYRAKKELGFSSALWEAGFTNRRIRDAEDYQNHREYIRENPVKAHLVERCKIYPYSSAFPGLELDAVPLGLKPLVRAGALRGS